MRFRPFHHTLRHASHRLGWALLCVSAVWSVPSVGAPGDIIFLEQFNNNGDYNSDWSDSGSGDASVTDDTFNSASRSLRIGEDTHTVISDSGRIDTSGISGADLSVWIRRGDDDLGDSEDPDTDEDLVFEYLNSSGTWVEFDTYTGAGTDGEIFTPTFTLPNDALYNNLRLRFRFLQGNGNNLDYWHIDDVLITETGTVDPPGTSCDTYADNFGSSSYTNSDGSLDWSGNAWTETNDDGSASTGLIEISGGQLELTGNNTTNNAAITREADTSTAYQMTLEFDFEMLGGIEADDAALLEISSNGGSSWTTLETFVGFSDGATGSRSYDISAYAASNMQIRFAIAPDDNSDDCCFGGGSERMEIDDLEIRSCSVIVPVAIADYRLDEASWSGAANEVLDSSGNGLNGQAINLDDLPTTDDSNRAIAGDPGTCGYGEFDGGADGYVEIADPGTGSILDLTSNFSVAVWIYPTAFPGSDLATIVSKDENFEFHLNPSGQVFWWWGGGGQQLTSSGTVTLNTWNHIAITYESGSQVIYINGVSQGTDSDSTAVTTNNDPLLIGTDLAYHSRRFTGLIDEVKVYDTTLEAIQVDYVMNDTHACPTTTVDHYRVGHAENGITCEAVAVTITAHDNADGAVVVAGRTIQVTATSATPGWTTADTAWALGSGGGTFSSPLPGVAQYQFAADESTVVLNFANISEAVIDFDVVDQGNPSITDIEGSITEDPTLSFSHSALRFYNDADGDGNRDGTDPIATPLTAGTPSNQLIVAAIRTNTDTGQCEARATGTQTVNIGYQCVNPTACFRSDDAEIEGTAIGENDLGITANLNPVSLTFDADGEAPFNLEYYDAGAIRLYAELPLAASGSDPAITLTGTSDDTVVRPADLVVTAITDSASNANPGTTDSGAGFLPSNAPFYVTVQARNADGGITPNFGTELVNEGIVLVPQNLAMPSGGTLAALSSASSFATTGTAGEFQNTSLRWPEAGTFTMRAQIADGDYLGTGNVLGTTSGNVGRFYPNQFDLAVTSVNEGCASGGFTYMSDQTFTYRPIGINFTITAQGVTGLTTTNYDIALSYPVRGFGAVAENANDGTPLTARASIQDTAWNAGVYTLSASDAAGFRRNLNGLDEEPDGPYASLQLGITPNSAGPDSIDFLAADLTMHPTQSNDCVTDGDCNAAALGSPLDLRFGRLNGASVHGPETAALAVPLSMEYWNGSVFVTNTDDDCTRIAAADILFDGNPLSTDANRTVTLGGGTTTGSFGNASAGTDIGFTNGDAGLVFSAPGAGNNGSFNIDFDLTNYPWLRSDWNNDGDSANDTALPSLEIYFGRYRGHDRIIYWEEVLN